MTGKKNHGSNIVSQASMPTTYIQGPTDYKEMQQNELAALQSIYMEDFEEVKVKAAAWSVCFDDSHSSLPSLTSFSEITRSRFQTTAKGAIEP
jgi:RWD domain